MSCVSMKALVSSMQLEAHRTIVIEAIDDNHCRHSVQGNVKVRIFGIGKLAENGVIESTVKTFRALPSVLERQVPLPHGAVVYDSA